MTAALDACFERIKQQAELPGMEETAGESPAVSEKTSLESMVNEKLEVMIILNRWLVSAKARNKKEAASDCERIMKFINSVCAW